MNRAQSAHQDAGVKMAKVNHKLSQTDIAADRTDPESAARTGFSWPGKAVAAELAARPAIGRLEPCPGLAIGNPKAEHLFIEGDNLESLKLLHAAYARRVKMIYIDPPYNTGRRFIYPDRGHGTANNSPDYADPHTGWLNMMYPRLLAARPLMRDDAAIFISIDDNELPRLRLLCDEVFGEDNFVAVFTWQTKRAARGVPPRNLLMVNHEYVVCYARDKTRMRLRGLDRDEKDFANPDSDPRGPWRSESMKATGSQDNRFTITDPATGHTFTANWAFAESTLNNMIADRRVLFPADPAGTPRQKKFLNSYRNPRKAAVTALGWHSTEKATKDLMALFDGKKVFDFPKPVSLLRYFCEQSLDPGDIALDFFAGSGSLGQAVMQLNAADNGDRRFILVQNDEPCDHRSSTAESGFDTIAEVCIERIKRVIDALDHSDTTAAQGPSQPTQKLGMKVCRVSSDSVEDLQD